MTIPGTVWGALMVALPLLSVWLEQNFGAYGWTPAVAGLLLIVVKVLEVMRSTEPRGTQMPETNMEMFAPVNEPSKAKRILWG